MIIPINDPYAASACIDVLRRGEIVIVPCDTIYGILGAVPETEQRIRMIKGREEKKPFLQLILTEWITGLAADPVPDELLSLWPGPLTLVVRHTGGGTIAYRSPEDEFLRALLTGVGRPLYSTSVNRSGSEPMNDPDEIIREFIEDVPLIVDGGQLKERLPSTILDITRKPWTVLRQGACRVPTG